MSVDVCLPRAFKKKTSTNAIKRFGVRRKRIRRFLKSPKGNRHREKVYLE